jgi:NTP pyrophosphatase (non-canonical NTP hydrolase)
MAFNELKRKVAHYDKRFGWVGDRPEQTILHMQEELGEISRNMLKKSKYKKERYCKEDMEDEITDLLYLTLKLGNLLDLDLDSGWGRIGKRYGKKQLKKSGSIS